MAKTKAHLTELLLGCEKFMLSVDNINQVIRLLTLISPFSSSPYDDFNKSKVK